MGRDSVTVGERAIVFWDHPAISQHQGTALNRFDLDEFSIDELLARSICLQQQPVTNGDFQADCCTFANAAANCYGYAFANAYTQPYSDKDSVTNGDLQANCYAFANAYPNTITKAHPDVYQYCYQDAYKNSTSLGNFETYQYADLYVNSYCDVYSIVHADNDI